MSHGWKTVVVGVLVALVVGAGGGYLLGALGKGDLSRELATVRARLRTGEEASRLALSSCEQEREAARVGKQVLFARGALLRAILEVQANNYGLAGQQLGEARRRLKAAGAALPRAEAARLAALAERLAGSHTLVMRLDPMARTTLENDLAEIERLPAAR